jgi:hypothetical protein
VRVHKNRVGRRLWKAWSPDENSEIQIERKRRAQSALGADLDGVRYSRTTGPHATRFSSQPPSTAASRLEPYAKTSRSLMQECDESLRI